MQNLIFVLSVLRFIDQVVTQKEIMFHWRLLWCWRLRICFLETSDFLRVNFVLDHCNNSSFRLNTKKWKKKGFGICDIGTFHLLITERAQRDYSLILGQKEKKKESFRALFPLVKNIFNFSELYFSMQSWKKIWRKSRNIRLWSAQSSFPCKAVDQFYTAKCAPPKYFLHMPCLIQETCGL